MNKNEMTLWEKNYRRYKRIYKAVVTIAMLIDIALWVFLKPFWGAAFLVFAFWNIYFYEKGATDNCMDEYEYAYPKDGFRTMFKSWIVLIPLLIGVYFLCRYVMPEML